MKLHTHKVCLVLLSLLLLSTLNDVAAQDCNPPDAEPGQCCAEAILTCLTDICFETTPDPPCGGTSSPNFCGGNTLLDNPQYYILIIEDFPVNISVVVNNCSSGNGGLQMATLTACPMNGGNNVIDCNGTGTFNWTSTIASTDGFNIGDQLYLMIDGLTGSICDYVLNVTNVFEPGLEGNDPNATGLLVDADIMFDPSPDFCAGQSNVTFSVDLTNIPLATNLDWSFSWDFSETITSSVDGLTIDLPTDLAPGTYMACVIASNSCTDIPEVCLPFDIFILPPEDGGDIEECSDAEVFFENPLDGPDIQFVNPYTVDTIVRMQNANSCAFDVSFSVLIHPAYVDPIILDPVLLCQNESYFYPGNGVTYDNDFAGEIALQTVQGCDSIVFLEVVNTDVILGQETIDCNNFPPYGGLYIEFTDTTFIPASASYQFLWNNPVTGENYIGNPLVFFPAETGTGDWDLTVELVLGTDTCLYDFGIYTLDHNDFYPLQPLIEGPSTFCEDGSSVFTVDDPQSDENYQWSVDLSSGSVDPFIGETTTVTWNSGVQSAWVYLIAQNSCGIRLDSIEVFSTPELDVEIQAAPLCPDGVATLDAVQQGTYIWSTNETTQTIQITDSGTYSVTVDQNGCQGIDEITITEETAPDPQLTTGGFCTGSTTTLNPGNFDAYLWSTSETSQNIEIDTEGTYSVTVTDSDGCTGVDSIFVPELDELDTGIGNLEYNDCNGVIQTITVASGFDTYIWSSDPSNNSNSIDINQNGTYSLTVSDGSGCTGDTSFTVNFYPLPEPSITGSATICPGNTGTIGTQSYTEYLWSTNETSQSIDVNAGGLYGLTVTDLNGCTGDTSFLVTQENELSPVISGDAFICPDQNQSTILDAGTGFDNYIWSTDPDGNDVIGTNPTLPVDMAGTYYLNVSITNSCEGDTFFKVTENTAPFAIVTPVDTVCQQSADGVTTLNFATLITGGDQGGVWSGALPGSGDFANADFEGVPLGDYTFTYTTASAIAPCADEPYTVTITVLDCGCPSPEFNVPDALCNDGDQIDLDNLIIPGVTEVGGSWELIPPAGATNPAVIEAGNIINANGVSAGVYTLSYVLANIPSGCDASIPQSLIITDPPNSGMEGDPFSVCVMEDQLINLADLLTGEDVGGMWTETSAVSSTGSAFNAIDGSFNGMNQVSGSYNFMYEVMGTGPCESQSSEVTVVIEPLPMADAGVAGTLTCDNPELTLGGNGNSTGANISYSWSNGNTSLNNVISNAGTYILTVTNTITGCSAISDVIIDSMQENPNIDDIVEMDVSCADGNDGMIDISVSGGQAPYSYSIDNVNFVNSNSFQNLSPGAYVITVMDQNGCSSTIDALIAEPEPLSVAFESANIVLQAQESASLVPIINIDPASIVNYEWMVDGVPINCPNCPTLDIEADTEQVYSLTITDENGCQANATINVLILIVRKVYIPNIFSPNDDGINDWFTVYSNDDVSMVNVLRVFNRWGALLFEATDFQANVPEAGWDGSFKSQKMQAAVFVYYVELSYKDGESEVFIGDISIVE